MHLLFERCGRPRKDDLTASGGTTLKNAQEAIDSRRVEAVHVSEIDDELGRYIGVGFKTLGDGAGQTVGRAKEQVAHDVQNADTAALIIQHDLVGERSLASTSHCACIAVLANDGQTAVLDDKDQRRHDQSDADTRKKSKEGNGAEDDQDQCVFAATDLMACHNDPVEQRRDAKEENHAAEDEAGEAA